jgi:hypothetical protein
MLPHPGSRRLLLVPILAMLPLGRPAPAHAFDTGPHNDMTRAAMQHEGFARESQVIGICQVSNWLVDYYSSRPTELSSDLPEIQGELARLHFDSLTSTAQIRNLWTRLARNTQAAVQSATASVHSAPDAQARYNRLVSLAVLIGASLHPVQDFYSHSNWVELYPMQEGVYGTRTWFDTPMPSTLLHTGLVGPENELNPSNDPRRDHGDYEKGMNHDSYTRPGWSEAYVYGYSASRQWLRAIRQWVEAVDPAVWRDLLTLELSSRDAQALADDLRAAYTLSLWVHSHGKNGGWKGWGSGDLSVFLPEAGKWVSSSSSIFVNDFRDPTAYRPLSTGMELRDTDPGPAPAMPRVALGVRAVEVRTLRAAMLSGSPDGFFNNADLYAEISIGGQRYVESTQQGEDDISPAWISVGLVPDSAVAVSIRYDLYDEDDTPQSILEGSPAKDVIDIHPAAGRTYAEFLIDVSRRKLSGDLGGIHDSEQTFATLRGGGGDRDPAEVTLYVTVRELEDTAASAPAFCSDRNRGTGPNEEATFRSMIPYQNRLKGGIGDLEAPHKSADFTRGFCLWIRLRSAFLIGPVSLCFGGSESIHAPAWFSPPMVGGSVGCPPRGPAFAQLSQE